MTDTVAPTLLETRIPGQRLWRRGKVRDVYDLGERLLVVATDRISAFDVVLPTGIPQKGVVLTQLSLFWFRLLADAQPGDLLLTEQVDRLSRLTAADWEKLRSDLTLEEVF